MKKIEITVTRNYSKTITVEVLVDKNLKEERLQDFLTNDELIDSLVEESLSCATLEGGGTEYEYYDTLEKTGGHL